MRYQTWHNRKKKELFHIRIKLSYYKLFHRTVISNRNEKKTQTLMDKPFYLGLSTLKVNKILIISFGMIM